MICLALLAGVALFTAVLMFRSRLTRRSLFSVAAVPTVGIVLLIAGCGGSSDSKSTDESTIKAVATTTQVADFVREVGGDKVEVSQILQPNTDPHDYEPRPSDVEAFTDADLVFRSGGHLDEWVGQLVDDSGSTAEIVDLSTDLPVELLGDEHEDEGHADEAGHEGSAEEHAGGEIDPHWWHDPTNAEAAVVTVAKALSDANPDDGNAFEAKAAKFSSAIGAVDDGFASCLAELPPEDRKMVTDHDAFGYLANHFDIEVVGTIIPALTTQAQPSAGELAELEDTIKAEGVKAVFPESSVSPKLSEAVASDTGASTDYVLYGDTLGPEGSGAATYLEMMESNADQIMRGLTGGKKGCQFP